MEYLSIEQKNPKTEENLRSLHGRRVSFEIKKRLGKFHVQIVGKLICGTEAFTVGIGEGTFATFQMKDIESGEVGIWLCEYKPPNQINID